MCKAVQEEVECFRCNIIDFYFTDFRNAYFELLKPFTINE